MGNLPIPAAKDGQIAHPAPARISGLDLGPRFGHTSRVKGMV
jgi:hypothetical protein